MLSFGPATSILLCVQPIDMRKSFHGLEALVTNELKRDPLSGHVFGFCNRARNLVKLLVWDGSGYWVLAKRLPRGTFAWPLDATQAHALSNQELLLLLGGIDLAQSSRRSWHRVKRVS